MDYNDNENISGSDDSIQEPVVQEPVVEEPVVEEPVAQEQNAYQYQQNTYGPNYGQSESQQTPPPYYGYQPPKQRIPRKKRTGWKVVLGGIGFGLIAAVFFIGATRVLDAVFPSNNTPIGTVKDSPVGSVNNVTGGAINQISDVSGIVSNVMPSIVSITQRHKQTGYSMFGQYYEGDATGSGSGFIVSQDNDELLIVTNNHVVEDADKIQVTFIDDSTAEATVKGTDSTADLAVLTIKMSKLKAGTKKAIKVAKLGDSDSTKVGQMAIAIGNALGYGQSVTVGYISAKDRKVTITDESNNKENVMTLLQTDAAINPGNSGGALLDIDGNVIGINSVKYASSEVEGMGYAIPMSKAIPIINELMKREVLNDDEKGYLGITGRNISEEVSKSYGMPVGIYVVEVGKSGSAYDAGVKVGDVITKINDTEVSTIEEVQQRVTAYRVGTEIKMTVKRSDDGVYKEKVLTVKLKGSSTLDDLETAQDSEDSSQGSNDGSSEDQSGGQAVPWGGSLY